MGVKTSVRCFFSPTSIVVTVSQLLKNRDFLDFWETLVRPPPPKCITGIRKWHRPMPLSILLVPLLESEVKNSFWIWGKFQKWHRLNLKSGTGQIQKWHRLIEKWHRLIQKWHRLVTWSLRRLRRLWLVRWKTNLPNLCEFNPLAFQI